MVGVVSLYNDKSTDLRGQPATERRIDNAH
jgi:hypothetical protein